MGPSPADIPTLDYPMPYNKRLWDMALPIGELTLAPGLPALGPL